MSLRGSRRTRVVLAGVAVVAAVVVALVVVAPWDSDPWDAPVVASEVEDFPARGSLADDSDLVEAAADAWRSGDSLDARTEPEYAIELLWAGEVDTAVVEDELYTDDQTPDRLAIVVLRSGYDLATFVVERNGDEVEDVNGLGLTDLSTYPSPLLALPGGFVLAADGQPESYEAAGAEGSVDTVEPDDGLLLPPEGGGGLTLRLEAALTSPSKPVPGVYVAGRTISVDPADMDRVWQLLTDSSTTGVGEALGDVVGPRTEREGGRLEVPEVEIVSELVSPAGRPVVVLSATGTGAIWSRAVVAVETAPLDAGPTLVPLGYAQEAGPWAGSAWITTNDALPYLVVAGGNGVERIDVFAGTESAQVAGSGIVAPVVTGTDNALPDVVVNAFTADGTVVAPMTLP